MLDSIYHMITTTVITLFGKKRQKVSEYDQEMQQLHTADQPTAPQGRATIAII